MSLSNGEVLDVISTVSLNTKAMHIAIVADTIAAIEMEIRSEGVYYSRTSLYQI